MKGVFAVQKENRIRNYLRTLDVTNLISEKDIQQSRISAACSYIFFFVPLIFQEDKHFARFHCNQAMLNLLLSTVVAVLLSIVPYAGPFLLLAQEIICIGFAARGVWLAMRGKAVGLPLVGRITLLVY